MIADGIVLVDTNVWFRHQFDFGGPVIQSLFKIAEQHRLCIVTNCVLELEIKRAIQKHFTKGDKLWKRKGLQSYLVEQGFVDGNICDKTDEELANLLFDNLLSLIKDFHLRIEISAKNCLQAYEFYGNEGTFLKNSKNELPDAVMALSLKEYCKKNSCAGFLISDDSGFCEFAEIFSIQTKSNISDFITSFENTNTPICDKKYYENALLLCAHECSESIIKWQDSFIETNFNRGLESVKLQSISLIDGAYLPQRSNDDSGKVYYSVDVYAIVVCIFSPYNFYYSSDQIAANPPENTETEQKYALRITLLFEGQFDDEGCLDTYKWTIDSVEKTETQKDLPNLALFHSFDLLEFASPFGPEALEAIFYAEKKWIEYKADIKSLEEITNDINEHLSNLVFYFVPEESIDNQGSISIDHYGDDDGTEVWKLVVEGYYRLVGKMNKDGDVEPNHVYLDYELSDTEYQRYEEGTPQECLLATLPLLVPKIVR